MSLTDSAVFRMQSFPNSWVCDLPDSSGRRFADSQTPRDKESQAGVASLVRRLADLCVRRLADLSDSRIRQLPIRDCCAFRFPGLRITGLWIHRFRGDPLDGHQGIPAPNHVARRHETSAHWSTHAQTHNMTSHPESMPKPQ